MEVGISRRPGPLADRLEEAFRTLPDGYELRVGVRAGECWVSLWTPGDDEVDLGAEPRVVAELPDAVAGAIRAAFRHIQEEA